MERINRIGLAPALVILAVAGVVATLVVSGFDTGASPGLSSMSPSASPSATPAASASSVARSADPAAPRYPMVTRTAAELAGGRADLYVPLPGSAGRPRERFPVAVLLVDPRTDASQYEQFAHEVGRYGVAVLVTDRPSDVVLREFRAWSGALDSDAYLHGLLDTSVSFVVAHERARVDASTAATVKAVVLLTPDRDRALPTRRSSLLVVCGRDPVAGLCPPDIPSSSTVRIDGVVPLSVTDQGRRSARVFGDVRATRLRTIALLAQPTGLWLLAHYGDATARVEVERLIG